MKISKIIDELTELQKYIGDKDIDVCVANNTAAGVNVMYENDDGDWTSTSLESRLRGLCWKDEFKGQSWGGDILDPVLL